MQLRVDVRRVWRGLGTVIGILLVAHVLCMISIFALGHDHVFGLVPLFNMDGEGNVPAWFSAGLLLFSAQLLLVTALAERRVGKPWVEWLGLSLIFAFLSIDELAVIHERIGWFVGDLVGAEGLLREYGWIGVYLPLGALLGVVYLRFLNRLPPRVRKGMLVAALFYVGGAAGIEVIGSPFWADTVMERGWPYLALVGLEETLEMVGVVLFIRAILLYGARSHLTIVIRERGGASEGSPPPSVSTGPPV